MEISIKNSNQIQPNTITDMYFVTDITARHLKILNAVIYKLQNKMTKIPEVAMSCETRSVQLNREECGAVCTLKEFLDSMNTLISAKVSWIDRTPEGYNELNVLVPFSGYKMLENTDYVKLTFNQDFIPVLINWQKGFTFYDGNVIRNLKNKNAILLYQIFCKNHDKGYIRMRIEDAVKLLSIKAGTPNKEIKRLITKAVEVINESPSWMKCSGFEMVASSETPGKKTSCDTIVFTISNESPQYVARNQKLLAEVRPTLVGDMLKTCRFPEADIEKILEIINGSNRFDEFQDRYFTLRNKYCPVGSHKEPEHFANIVKKIINEDFHYAF